MERQLNVKLTESQIWRLCSLVREQVEEFYKDPEVRCEYRVLFATLVAYARVKTPSELVGLLLKYDEEADKHIEASADEPVLDEKVS